MSPTECVNWGAYRLESQLFELLDKINHKHELSIFSVLYFPMQAEVRISKDLARI
jgi:hypothetical protein